MFRELPQLGRHLLTVAVFNQRPGCFLGRNDPALLNRGRPLQRVVFIESLQLLHPLRGRAPPHPSQGEPEHQGAAAWCWSHFGKVSYCSSRKLLLFSSSCLPLVWPGLSVMNEIRSKVWRKLNAFLGSVARNLQSSGQKPI